MMIIASGAASSALRARSGGANSMSGTYYTIPESCGLVRGFQAHSLRLPRNCATRGEPRLQLVAAAQYSRYKPLNYKRFREDCLVLEPLVQPNSPFNRQWLEASHLSMR